jgi:Prokaryotic homologs of the JAB domain
MTLRPPVTQDGPAAGRLLVAEQVLAPTRAALQASSHQHQAHEGLVFWIGRTIGPDTLVLSVVAVPTDHHRGGVFVNEHTVAATGRAARTAGLGLVAQVHSHPDSGTRHSVGDNQLITMPFEGMFSLVVADYGQGDLLPGQGAGLHQYQRGRWVHLTTDALVIVPALTSIGSCHD